MAFKTPISRTSVPESPDRLFRDLPRRKHASLFDHQGQVLRNYVAQAVDKPDVALQLPTGSGKTLVGLLLAEWRRRKNQEKIVYLCPTRQLVNQVAEEAENKYGLSVQAFTGSVKEYSPEAKSSYIDGERVAVTTYSSLFNTNPFFSDPDVVIVDDAHAAEAYISSMWTMRIGRFEECDESLYSAIVSVLKDALRSSDYRRMTGSWDGVDDASWVDKIPTYELNRMSEELSAVISENIGNSESRYAWRMIKDRLSACQLYVSSAEVLIRPLIPPTWTHRPFDSARQRIFMSATLGEGGDLERLTGRRKIARLPVPDGWDKQGIGRRFFIFPERSLDDRDVQELRRRLMRKAGRSLVLTPSKASADDVSIDISEMLGFPVFSAADIEQSKEKFVSSENAVAVIANRYDGIDLPEDDCRLLFVEGLPRATNAQEKFLMNRMGANLLFNERMQARVLQAIGRCTRGLNDYSAVVVTGEDLPGYLTDRRRRKYFHPELQAELEFGVEQSTEVSGNDICENFEIFLEHEEEWEEANSGILDMRECANQERSDAMEELEKVVRHEISWQKAMWDQDYVAAFDAAREVLGGLSHEGLRGYRALWFYLAGSAAELAADEGEAAFSAHARACYTKAKSAASGIPWLIRLARGSSDGDVGSPAGDQTVMLQVEQLEKQLVDLGTVQNRKFSAREREIRDGLQIASKFEQAQVLLGRHLGFIADKREEDASPDPWWMVGDYVIVFEDHANAKGPESIIDATKARQAASHPDWIRESIPEAADANIISVLVSPAKNAKRGALPSLRNVAFWELSDYRDWADQALVTIRDLRRSFVEPGDLVWRAQAAEALCSIRADAKGLSEHLAARSAADCLQVRD